MKKICKIFKKPLACILAFAIVICSLTTTLAVFAVGETAAQTTVVYRVTYGSPAIPMFLDTEIDLTAVEVQFTASGEFIQGENITWQNGDNVITSFTAATLGTTKITATYGEQSQNVYVIVNNADDYNFYLVNEDLTGNGAFNANDGKWIVGSTHAASSITGTSSSFNRDRLFEKELYAVSPTAVVHNNSAYPYFESRNTKTFVTANSTDYALRTYSTQYQKGVLFYKSDILKDFADYTIEYDAAYAPTVAAQSEVAYFSRLGIIARADVDYDKAAIIHPITYLNDGGYLVGTAEGQDAPQSFIGSNGGLTLGLTAYSGLLVGRLKTGYEVDKGYHTADSKYFRTVTSSRTNQARLSKPIVADTDSADTATWDEYNKYNLGYGRKTVKIMLSGQDIVYTIKAFGSDEEVTVLDTINGGDSIKSITPNTNKASYGVEQTPVSVTADAFKGIVGEVTKGTVGFLATNDPSHAYYNLKVKLNVNSAEDMPSDAPILVDPNSPALGMYVNTQISLANIYMLLSDGQTYSGSELSFELADVSLSNNVFLNNTDKTFAAFATGVYKFIVRNSDASASANLYFVVNNEGDTDFCLINEDLTGQGSFNPDEWIFGTTDGQYLRDNPFKSNLYAISPSTIVGNNKPYFHSVNTYTFADSPQYNYILRSDGSSMYSMGVLFYKSDILKDFSDYTVEYETAYNPNATTESYASQPYYNRLGLIVRADIDYEKANIIHNGADNEGFVISDATKTSFIGQNGGLVLGLTKYSGLLVTRLNSAGTPSNIGYHTADNKYFATQTASRKVAPVVDDDAATNTPAWSEYNQYNIGFGRKTVKVMLSGQDIVYTLKAFGSDEEITVLDTINDSDNIKSTAISQNKTTTAEASTTSVVTHDAFADVVGETAKGTVGLLVTGSTPIGYYNFKVMANNIAVVRGKACYSDMVSVNCAIDINSIEQLSDNDLTIANKSTARCLLKDGTLAALSEGLIYFENSNYFIRVSSGENALNTVDAKRFAPEEISVYETNNGYSFSVPKVYNIIPGSFDVAVIDENAISKYTTVDGQEIEYLDYTVNNTVYNLSIAETVNDNDIIYSITYAGSLYDIEVRAEFAENIDTLNSGIYEYGQLYYDKNKLDENKGYDNALYFLTAIPAVKQNSTGGTTVSGNNIEKIGTIFIPSALLGDAQINENTVSPSENPNNVIIEGALAEANKVEYTVSNATNSYYTLFEGSITDIPDNMKAVLITAVTYIKYTDGTTVYGEAVQNSYRNVEQMIESGVQMPKGILSEKQYKEKMEQLSGGEEIIKADYSYMSAVGTLTDRLKDRIVYNSQDVSPAEEGNTTYYVSPNGNDQNSGTSPETAWATLARVRQANFVSGDVLLFERGGEYRGWFNVYDGVTVGAYGNGQKPKIICARTAESLGGWVATETPNVWKLQNPLDDYIAASDGSDGQPYQADLGHVVFYMNNGEEICGDAYRSLSSLNKDYDFYYDGVWSDDLVISEREDGTLTSSEIAQIEHKISKNLYIYYSGNPNDEEIFNSIEIPYDTTVIRVPTANTNKVLENVTINNLFITHGRGPLWVGGEGGNNIYISYCVFGWHGGFASGSSGGSRYGGGSGAWKNCDGFVYDSCWFYQQFDAGVTPQFDHSDTWLPDGDSVFKDFITKFCLFETTEYTLEYFDTLTTTQTNGFIGMDFSYNICLKGGCGFGTKPQRSAYVKSWQHENTCFNSVGENKITHNIFDRAASICLEITGKSPDGTRSLDYIPNLEGNIYIEPKDKEFAKINNVIYKFNEQSYATIESLGIETGAKYVYVD